MSKFSKRVFIIYILSLVVLWIVSTTLYWIVILTVLALQIINMILRNFIDKLTSYNGDKLYYESEKLRFIYAYFGFPIVLFFLKYFRQLRKDSYYERTLQHTEDIIDLYKKNDFPIDEKLKNLWINCNRYLKLKKIKHKQEDSHTSN